MRQSLDALLERMRAAKAAVAEADAAQLYTPSEPGPPASPAALTALAEAIPGLPIDYIAFLARVNGWQGFHQMIDLFPAEELVRGSKRVDDARAGLREALRYYHDDRLGSAIPIGAASTDRDVLAVVPTTASVHPGLFFWFAGEVVEQYPDFERFFEGMVAGNLQAAEAAREFAGPDS